MKRGAGPLPEGFVYRPGFITEAEERTLLDATRTVAFEGVRMHGVTARRRVAHYGWRYGYTAANIAPGPAIPPWLEEVRARLAALAQVQPEDLAEALVTEYPPGANRVASRCPGIRDRGRCFACGRRAAAFRAG